MADMILELTGKHFKRQYLLYVVQLSHRGNAYYYVGQTGDTRIITARPVFRRLAAHLEDRKSTQNQVYQYIAHNILNVPENEGKKIAFTEKTRQKVEEYLINCTIKMHAYHLEPFISEVSSEEHHAKRRNTLKMEKLIIRALHKNGKNVMNSKSTSDAIYIDCPFPEVLRRVKKDFALK